MTPRQLFDDLKKLFTDVERHGEVMIARGKSLNEARAAMQAKNKPTMMGHGGPSRLPIQDSAAATRKTDFQKQFQIELPKAPAGKKDVIERLLQNQDPEQTPFIDFDNLMIGSKNDLANQRPDLTEIARRKNVDLHPIEYKKQINPDAEEYWDVEPPPQRGGFIETDLPQHAFVEPNQVARSSLPGRDTSIALHELLHTSQYGSDPSFSGLKESLGPHGSEGKAILEAIERYYGARPKSKPTLEQLHEAQATLIGDLVGVGMNRPREIEKLARLAELGSLGAQSDLWAYRINKNPSLFKLDRPGTKGVVKEFEDAIDALTSDPEGRSQDRMRTIIEQRALLQGISDPKRFADDVIVWLKSGGNQK